MSAAPSGCARSAGAATAAVPADVVAAEEALEWTAAVLLALLFPLVSAGAWDDAVFAGMA